ncbi:hypothetical protein MPNT_330002 [Candidatus Methylacidithermus pantelleriae]|uniref:Uncharacterized protein n=1 Tax=Candidatus Methylacidithermus pantelleriae TaxID=2744239 RepID=A0A8J2BTU2_9BACT|nr:hypothetical protein MPNT_330002 [Candidatus Methylacidithermus pantelleriae]
MGWRMWCAIEMLTNRNGVDPTPYQLIWCPKVWCDVLTVAVARETGGILDGICAERG